VNGNGAAAESRESDLQNHSSIVRDYLIAQHAQRSWTSYVCLAAGIFTIGMFLSVFYSIGHTLMAHLTAIIESTK
jgi:hypothetical protein